MLDPDSIDSRETGHQIPWMACALDRLASIDFNGAELRPLTWGFELALGPFHELGDARGTRSQQYALPR